MQIFFPQNSEMHVQAKELLHRIFCAQHKDASGRCCMTHRINNTSRRRQKCSKLYNNVHKKEFKLSARINWEIKLG